jgi:ATP adenylyltransferase
MDRLWAPWRIKYLTAKKKKKCIFCQSKKRSGDYVVLRSAHSLAVLNIFPYNNGHIMVSPMRHVKDILQLKDMELLDLLKTVNRAKVLLDKILKPDGYNIGMNLFSAGGAGIPGHLHIHIVPRWKGDANFMPVLSDTKVISQSLDELYKKLKHAQSGSN